jgi:hypothetical protein
MTAFLGEVGRGGYRVEVEEIVTSKCSIIQNYFITIAYREKYFDLGIDYR